MEDTDCTGYTRWIIRLEDNEKEALEYVHVVVIFILSTQFHCRSCTFELHLSYSLYNRRTRITANIIDRMQGMRLRSEAMVAKDVCVDIIGDICSLRDKL